MGGVESAETSGLADGVYVRDNTDWMILLQIDGDYRLTHHNFPDWQSLYDNVRQLERVESPRPSDLILNRSIPQMDPRTLFSNVTYLARAYPDDEPLGKLSDWITEHENHYDSGGTETVQAYFDRFRKVLNEDTDSDSISSCEDGLLFVTGERVRGEPPLS